MTVKCAKKSRFIIVIVIIMLSISVSRMSSASIAGVHGIKYSSNGDVVCNEKDVPRLDPGSYYKGGACTINATGYVPVSGQYRVKMFMGSDNTGAVSTAVYLDATKSLSSQNVSVSGSDVPIPGSSIYASHTCYALLDESGKQWALNTGRGCSGLTPIPPTPPAPPTSCSVNNGNALNVNLGTIDRAQLVTVPGTGSARHIQIPVVCTGGVNVPVNMTTSYTPITVSGKQVIKSTSNGLGVSIIYNEKVLATTDTTPVQFISGSNVLDLAFEAVRDPNVPVADVTTGSFTASATVIMTQQ